jgi:hypothetical protein
MGTSFVEYKGFGFWSRDSFLESWLNALMGEIQALPKLEPWLASLLNHWRVQASIDGGVMSLALDDFLTNKAREDFVLLMAKEALAHTPPLGYQTGELFIQLLAGSLRTLESSPIDYLSDPETG